jgi:hypothetical protein
LPFVLQSFSTALTSVGFTALMLAAPMIGKA